MSVRGALLIAAVGVGLSACAIPAPDGCQYAASAQSAGPRAMGGRTLICDPNLIGSAERMPHADDYVLENEMW